MLRASRTPEADGRAFRSRSIRPGQEQAHELIDRHIHLLHLFKRSRRTTEKLSRLAELTGVNERTVKRDLAQLRALGLIETQPRGRQGVCVKVVNPKKRIGDISGTNQGHRGHENRGQNSGSKSLESADNRGSTLAGARVSPTDTVTQRPLSAS